MSTALVQTENPISLTPSAAAEIKAMLSKENPAEKNAFRVFVEAGGCSGMQYGMTFDLKRESDVATEILGVTVVVDTISLDFLRGAVIDFSDAMSGGGFKITNPRAKQSCGCGKSFET